MGFLDKIAGKKEEKKDETAEQIPMGKYSQACSMCGNPGTDKKWMGQFWHVKCMRSAKRASKKML
ncbi:MAG: hypothetical protein NUV67_06105 [archaeon]|nr:hypothetical protein [archaeon]